MFHKADDFFSFTSKNVIFEGILLKFGPGDSCYYYFVLFSLTIKFFCMKDSYFYVQMLFRR